MTGIDAYKIYRKVWAEENIFSPYKNQTINRNGKQDKEKQN